MTVDAYGRVNIDIQDGFGNTLISKMRQPAPGRKMHMSMAARTTAEAETEET